MATERREFLRLHARLNISYKITDTKQLGKSLSKDMSGGGVRFVAEHPLEIGAQVDITLHLDMPVRFRGEVVWSKPVLKSDTDPLGGTEVGVRLIEITPKELALIKQYASIYAPPPPQP
jgi:c-di-GMP-binding flagellar brake protein YcgR